MHLLAKLFTFKDKNMKAKIQIGFKSWVLDHDKAIQILTMLDDAELYDSKYHKDTGSGAMTTHYVYANDEVKQHNLELIPDKLYAMWKLAGKPTKE
jgi:hypothetical protein